MNLRSILNTLTGVFYMRCRKYKQQSEQAQDDDDVLFIAMHNCLRGLKTFFNHNGSTIYLI